MTSPFSMSEPQPLCHWLALLALFCLPSLCPAEPVPPRPSQLSAHQALQERARTMARELMASVIDTQLRQLEDNGLTNLPIHAQIASMRSTIDAIVTTDMQGVVELLAESEARTPAEQASRVVEARRMIRHITIRLMAERQQILRRLKIADIAAQVRRLIHIQTSASQATESLPQQPSGKRESLTLTTIEQQRTVESLCAALTQTLHDVRTWDGPLGIGAHESLRRLKDARSDEALDSALDRLAASDFATAFAAQRHLLATFESLLNAIETSQGVGDTRNKAALDAVREVLQAGTKLRNEIATTPLTDQSVERLVEKQSQFREDIHALSELVGGVPHIQPLLAQAKEAALESTARLFDGDQRQAVAEESKALGNLAAIAERIERAEPAHNDSRSADQLAARVNDLRNAAVEMAEVLERQKKAADAAQSNPQAAIQPQQEVAAAIPRVQQKKDLPASVTARLEEAAEAAVAAAKTLAEPPTQQPSPAAGVPTAAKASVDAAMDAVKESSAEIARAIADTERIRAATQIAELSRAAEAMERAAAAEHAIAEQAEQMAAQAGEASEPSKGEAQAAMAAEQQDIAAVAEKVAQGIKATAPAAAEAIAIAQKSMAKAQNDFDALAASSDNPIAAPAGDPAKSAQGDPAKSAQGDPAKSAQGDPAKSAQGDPAKSAQEAAAQAHQAASELAHAASEIRSEMAHVAAELDRTTQAQLSEAIAAQQAAESAIPEPSSAAPSAQAQSPEQASATAPQDGAQPADSPHKQSPEQAQMDAQASAEREAANLALREAHIARDQSLASAIAEQAIAQKQARAEIADRSTELNDQMAPHSLESAQALKGAEERFAEAQQAIGEDASAIAGQTEIANQPLREALALASQLNDISQPPLEPSALSQPELGPGQPTPGQPTPGQPTPGQPTPGEPTPGQPTPGQPTPGEPTPGQPTPGQPTPGQPTPGQPTPGQPTRGQPTPGQPTLGQPTPGQPTLGQPTPGQPAPGQPAPGQPTPGQPTPGQPTPGQPTPGQPTPRQPTPGQPTPGQPTPGQPTPGQPTPGQMAQAADDHTNPAENASLGSGFVPQNPETTAKLIAGQKAQAAADSALAFNASKSTPAGEPSSPASDPVAQTSDQEQPSEGNNSQMDGPSGSRRGQAIDSSPLKPTDRVGRKSDSSGPRVGDAEEVARSFEKEGWFAKLPPEMRKAIRAKSQRRAPRGYEEKLDRYFQNID